MLREESGKLERGRVVRLWADSKLRPDSAHPCTTHSPPTAIAATTTTTRPPTTHNPQGPQDLHGNEIALRATGRHLIVDNFFM